MIEQPDYLLFRDIIEPHTGLYINSEREKRVERLRYYNDHMKSSQVRTYMRDWAHKAIQVELHYK